MVVLLLVVGAVSAHTLAPARVTLTQEDETVWRLEQRMPWSAYGLLRIRPSPTCASTYPEVEMAGGLATITQTLTCETPPEKLSVSGIEESGSAVILEIQTATGEGLTTIDVDGRWPLPMPEPPKAVLRQYLRSGGHHVLVGIDHVLVVLGLGWLSDSARSLFGVLTGFTVGHSMTLGACVVGGVQAPAAIIEPLIAATLIALAWQIYTHRSHGVILATVFGLLHGLGFGSGLLDLGFPPRAIGLALLGFNLGVEAAQLLIVTVAAGALWGIRRLGGKIKDAWLAMILCAVGTYLFLHALLGGLF
ncbi:MAG: HupE/UreJ family protein [Myxococcota bacterium]